MIDEWALDCRTRAPKNDECPRVGMAGVACLCRIVVRAIIRVALAVQDPPSAA
jgi:hypothetical protein